MLWPTESANQVLLQWTTSAGRKSSSICKLIYDETHHYLRIVDAGTNDVLDTMDGYDILGANIAIDTNDEAKLSNPRVTTTSAAAAAATPSIDAIPTDTQAHATLTIYVYPREPPKPSLVSSLYRTCRTTTTGTPTYVRPSSFSKYGARCAHHRSLTVQPVEDLFHVREVVKAIQAIAKYNPTTTTTTTGSASPTSTPSTGILPPAVSDDNKQLHYVIICNPEAGPKRNAHQIVHGQVVPMLQQANIEATLCVTTHPGHAMELCHLRENDTQDTAPAATTTSGTTDTSTTPSKPHPLQRLESDIAYYNGIIVMGGDGTMHEVIQGLQSRVDAHQVLTTIPIGIIGCGTANGLATSLQYTSHMYNKDPAPPASTSPYDFSYKGIVNDIFAAAKGYTIQADLATYTILDAKSDDVVVNTTSSEQEQKQNPAVKKYTSFLTFTYGLIAEVDIESERIHWMGSSRFDVWAFVRVLFLRTYPIKLSYTTDTTSSNVPSISDPIPSTWITIEDKITLFWASQVSHAGSTVYNSPPTKTADGMITIMVIRGNVSRIQLIMILLGVESGSHVNMKGVEWIRCSAYRLEPVVGTNIRNTYNNIDGEKVEYGPIQGVVLPKAAKYFISPP